MRSRRGRPMGGARCAYCFLPTMRHAPRRVHVRSCSPPCDQAIAHLALGKDPKKVRLAWEEALHEANVAAKAASASP